ncbi:alpha/beta hydrolase fold-domain-containing protein [Microdochium bolleyi]|uniref:Alpha/beta hydrolase fold-domain-containing protein n=1 Tax=Microdochium bolleyi TaxID=196109 RepID=A0A136IK60_9PEZI|nr:alpha/beta hydrolase fold-domain-containing protein [Microdochium bolleyi]
MTTLSSTFDNVRLTLSLALLRWYIIPGAKLRVYLARVRGRKGPTLMHVVTNATIQWFAKSLSTLQFRAVTSACVDVQALLAGCPSLLEENAQCGSVNATEFDGLWLSRAPGATHTIMYIHGGGFVSGSPCSAASYLLQLAVELRARGVLVDILAVGYDLAPEHPFPHALRQISSAYTYILARGKPIVLAGDSAGGNLCLALLRHLSEPHPAIPPVDCGIQAGVLVATCADGIVAPGTPGVIAACLMSPWVNLRNDGESYHRNASKDCLHRGALNTWSKAYLDSQPMDKYTCPITCTTGWAAALPASTLLMSGELDLFVADILAFASNVEKVS